MAMAYISHAVRNKYSGCGATLLGGPCDVGHPQTNDEANYRSKEPNDGVSSNGRRSSMGPAASPDHSTARDDG